MYYLIRKHSRKLHILQHIYSIHFSLCPIQFYFHLHLLRFVIPESPRWLLCKGRTAEVATIIRKVCEVNKRECPPNLEKLLKPPPSNDDQTDDGCISLFGNSYLRLITICFWCIWFTINLVYYGLILNMNSFGGNVYLNSVSFSTPYHYYKTKKKRRSKIFESYSKK